MKKYYSFVKIEHTVFSLPIIYAGMMLGLLAYELNGKSIPSNKYIRTASILILLAATGARTAGFALNRIIDRHIDLRNPRTSMRDLPSGRMTLRQGYIVLTAGILVYVTAAYLLNPLCLMLSPIPLAVFFIYPYMKRFTKFAHFGVGLSLALGPAGGYFAVYPYIDHHIVSVLLLTVLTSYILQAMRNLTSAKDFFLSRQYLGKNVRCNIRFLSIP
jgi:4-hydroxybenzoate polyprenyltransferase